MTSIWIGGVWDINTPIELAMKANQHDTWWKLKRAWKSWRVSVPGTGCICKLSLPSLKYTTAFIFLGICGGPL